jgi:DUF1680 family protein
MTFIFNVTGTQYLNLNLRIPYWTANATILMNGKQTGIKPIPSSFAEISRNWQTGDKLQLLIPMRLHSQKINDSEEVAFMYGPLVLAGLINRNETVQFCGNLQNLEKWIQKIGSSLTFRTIGQQRDVVFKPLYQLVDEVYGIYWKVDK